MKKRVLSFHTPKDPAFRILPEKLEKQLAWGEYHKHAVKDKLTSASYWNNNPEILQAIEATAQNTDKTTFSLLLDYANAHSENIKFKKRDFAFDLEKTDYSEAKKSRHWLAVGKEMAALSSSSKEELYQQAFMSVDSYETKVKREAAQIVLDNQLSGGDLDTMHLFLEKADFMKKFSSGEYDALLALKNDVSFFVQNQDFPLSVVTGAKNYSYPKKGLQRKGEIVSMKSEQGRAYNHKQEAKLTKEEAIQLYHSRERLGLGQGVEVLASMGVYHSETDMTPEMYAPLGESEFTSLEEETGSVDELLDYEGRKGNFNDVLYHENGMTFVSLDENFAHGNGNVIDDLIAFYDNS